MAHFVILFFTYFHKNKTHDNTYKVLQKKIKKKIIHFYPSEGKKVKNMTFGAKSLKPLFSMINEQPQ